MTTTDKSDKFIHDPALDPNRDENGDYFIYDMAEFESWWGPDAIAQAALDSGTAWVTIPDWHAR